MATADAVASPEGRDQHSVVIADLGFPQRLQAASWFFSVFLIVFPPIAIIGLYVTQGIVLISVPLVLMAICGGFGLRLSLQLEDGR